MIQGHADAILGLLRADPQLTVYPAANNLPGSASGIVPDDANPPYVAVHIYVERPLGDGGTGEALDGLTSRARCYVYCHCVGMDEIGARAVAQRVAALLLDVRPAVSGRQAFPIRYESGQPPRNDEATGRLASELTDVYRLETVPA